MDAVKKATVYQRELWAKAEDEAMKAIIEAGVKVTTPDKSVFESQSKGMIEDLQNQDKELYDLAIEIKNAQ
ncbi:MAG: hypothetical protein P8X62_04235 [Flavobacteriaceae bacterium]